MDRSNMISTRYEHLRPCPLCGCKESEFLFFGRDRLHGLPGRFPVHCCNRCGVAYLARYFELGDLLSFYPETYYSYKGKNSTPSLKGLKALELHFRRQIEQAALSIYLEYPEVEQISHLAKLIARLKRRKYLSLPRFRKQGRLLDVGCGSGEFLEKMKSLGWEVYGVEIGKQGALAAQQRGLNVFHGTLDQAKFPNDYFDFIRFEHVLEHVPDPVATLKEARRILRPDGEIRLTVPNWNSWPAKWFGTYWFHLDTPRHLIWFSPKTLALAAQKSDLAVAEYRILVDYSDIADSIIYFLEDHCPSLGKRMRQRRLLWKITNRISFPLRWGMSIAKSGSLLQATLVREDRLVSKQSPARRFMTYEQ